MKTKIYILGLLLIALSITTSCDDFGDLNTDPTNSTVANPKTLISTVQVRYSGDRETAWRALMSYHMGITQMVSDGYNIAMGQTYLKTLDYMEYMWRSSYRNVNDLTLAIEEAEKNTSQVNYQAVARILKVMIFAQLTDSYGDIPYFEAGAQSDDANIHPAYDDQKDIYYDFFKELKEAAAQLDASKGLDGDLIYGGDTEKWKKFANSLRLRYAMRLVNVDPGKAKEEVKLAIQDGVMTSIDDAAAVSHGNYDVSLPNASVDEIRGNGFSQAQQPANQVMVACDTYVEYMRENNDPRMLMMFGMYGAYLEDAVGYRPFKSTTETSVEVTKEYLALKGKLIGFPPGFRLWDDTNAQDFTWTPVQVEKDGRTVVLTKYFKSLQLKRELTRLDLPTIYQSYSEVELWLAEAAEIGWGGDAKNHYTNAINASVDELVNILGASPNIDINTGDYAENLWNNTGDKLEAINMQHYMNNFFNGIEGFTNWRRSGFPKLKPANHINTDPSLNGLIPRRLPYPNTEMDFNRNNLQDHLSEGVNFWGAPVWWDNSFDRGVDQS